MIRLIYGLGLLCIFGAGILSGMQYAFYSSQETELPKVECKPWFSISRDVEKKLLNDYAKITSGKSVGSGCIIKPGYYLTALHVVSDGILNESPLAVNDQKAQVVAHSSTADDIAIVTTFAEFSKEDAQLDEFNEFQDDQDIIIVGTPGPLGPFVQPAKIIRDVYDDNKQKKPGAKMISAQYIEHGISGGCVYSADGNSLLGIVTQKYDSNSLGEMSTVSKTLK